MRKPVFVATLFLFLSSCFSGITEDDIKAGRLPYADKGYVEQFFGAFSFKREGWKIVYKNNEAVYYARTSPYRLHKISLDEIRRDIPLYDNERNLHETLSEKINSYFEREGIYAHDFEIQDARIIRRHEKTNYQFLMKYRSFDSIQGEMRGSLLLITDKECNGLESFFFQEKW